MHPDTTILSAHLRREDFQFQELNQNEAVREACAQWALFDDIFTEPAQAAAADDGASAAGPAPAAARRPY